MPRADYSRWDGSQVGFDFDADAVLAEVTDDLLYHGDLNAALRRMLQSGFRDRDGNRVQGMRELLERLRRKRREELERHDLGGVYDEVADALREVVETERQGLDELEAEARASGDARRQEITEEVTSEKRLRLDLLPPDLAGQVRELSEYEFASSEARERFEELMDQLRQQLAQSYFNNMAGAMSNPDPEAMARMKDMLSELNSMTPEQRAQLQGLAEQLLEDMDLRWQVDQLASNLRGAFPGAGWERRFDFSGSDPLGFSEANDVLRDLGDMDQLEQLLRSASNPGALAEVDLDRARTLLGDDAALSLERMSQVAKMLEDAGLIEHREGRYELTPKGIRKIGQNALSELFQRLSKDAAGRHEVERLGAGHERAHSSKPYEFGDPFNLDIQRTVRNGVRRAGRGTPVSLLPEDFEVEETETLTRSATVLMLDVSLSMPMRDNFLAAKKVAMALHSLISSQFPRDFLGMVTFSKVARELRPEHLPEVSWDFDYGTNMQHGLLLSRRLLARQSGTKQVIMITDGEPTAHFEPGMDEPFFSYPPVRETVDATLREVNRCTRDGIRINTFMLDASGYLKAFVEKLTQLNRGRAFFTTPETLGDYVLVDFIEQRRSAAGRGRRTA